MSSIGLGHVKQGLAGRTLLSGKEEATLLWMIITQQPVFCHAESPPPRGIIRADFEVFKRTSTP